MTPLDGIVTTLVHVASAKADREQRPIAVERVTDTGGWTVRPESEASPAGCVRLAVVQPGDNTEEAKMGVAKRVATALQTGQPVSTAVLALLGQPKRQRPPEPVGETLLGAIEAKRIADTVPQGAAVAGNSIRDLQARVRALPAVERFVAEHGDRQPLAPGVPCAHDLVTFHYPHLEARLERFLAENAEPEAPATVPSRRERALRRSDGPALPFDPVGVSLAFQMRVVGPSLYANLVRWVGCYRDYAEALDRARELGKRFGDRHRYVDDTRRNRWDPDRAEGRGLIGARRYLREFARMAPENHVNARELLRAVWNGQPFEGAAAAAEDQAVHEQEQRLAGICHALRIVGWHTDPDRPGYTRRYLESGWFIEHEPEPSRAPGGNRWSLWNPGAAEGGFAAPQAHGDTFAELVDRVHEWYSARPADVPAEPAPSPLEAIKTSPLTVAEPEPVAPARRGRGRRKATAGQGTLFD